MFKLGIPELLIYLLPIITGVVAGRYLRRLPNFLLMLGALYVGSAILLFVGGHRADVFLAALLAPFLSPGGLLPILIIALFAWRFSRRSEAAAR